MLIYCPSHWLYWEDPRDAWWQRERFHSWNESQPIIYELLQPLLYCQFPHIILRIYLKTRWLSLILPISHEYVLFFSNIQPPEFYFQLSKRRLNTSRRTGVTYQNHSSPGIILQWPNTLSRVPGRYLSEFLEYFHRLLSTGQFLNCSWHWKYLKLSLRKYPDPCKLQLLRQRIWHQYWHLNIFYKNMKLSHSRWEFQIIQQQLYIISSTLWYYSP